MVGIGVWNCNMLEYNEDEEDYLIVLKCIFLYISKVLCMTG
ncbi:hypothetical protein HU200_048055 [Digitaria exilis]|uniref:Uncharacterized protein n=1 Tax=Digitaria exilis TaxID=1010633 RepID=A0A835ATM3_9POAL|nr:hypothetical protein HU200_048055 [Digitaria exilis]